MKPERKTFLPLANLQGGFGELAIGEDGTMLYRAIEVMTGNLVTVCLYGNEETCKSLMDGMLTLQLAHDDFMAQPKQDFTPADIDFKSILDSLKKGTKH